MATAGAVLIVTVQASDVNLDLQHQTRSQVVKKALRKAIEPVTGDAVFVERWETITDAQGNWAGRSGRTAKRCLACKTVQTQCFPTMDADARVRDRILILACLPGLGSSAP